MRKRWKLRIAAPLVCAAAIACGGTDGANDDRRATASQPPAAGQAASYAPVQLSGCVEPGPGSAEYVLRNVRFEPRQQGDSHADTTTPGNHGITEGSWVRLRAGDQDLAPFLGQRVKLNGTIMDDGANRRGVSGTSGVQTPSGDRSQAGEAGEHHADKQKKEMGRIARESMADGTAAEIRVERVEATRERCQAGKP